MARFLKVGAVQVGPNSEGARREDLPQRMNGRVALGIGTARVDAGPGRAAR